MELTEVSLHVMLEYAMKPLTKRVKAEFTETELLEALKDASFVLQSVTSLNELHFTETSKRQCEVVVTSVIRDVCFPMLYSIHHLHHSEKGRAVSVLTRLILVSCRYLDDQLMSVVVSQLIVPLMSVSCARTDLLSRLKHEAYHCQVVEPLDVSHSLDILGLLVNNEWIFHRYLSSFHSVRDSVISVTKAGDSVEPVSMTRDSVIPVSMTRDSVEPLSMSKDDLLEQLFHVTTGCCEQDSVFCKVFSNSSKLLTYFPLALKQKCTAQVWHSFARTVVMTDGRVDRDLVWQSLYVFYCLKDHFFPLDKLDMEELSFKLGSTSFWMIIQAGLTSLDPSHRKLAMYLLKRLLDTCNKNSCSVSCANQLPGSHANQLLGSHVGELTSLPLFWWCPKFAAKLSVIWEDFILLMETLEEKQAHIIKPLLPRMQKLITASTVTQDGSPLFHSSWLVTIVTRCFQHDSVYMSRWGAHTLLTLNFELVPLVPHGQLGFLSHDLMVYLQENKLYSRYEGTELGKSSPVGEALKDFFANLFSALTREQKGEYLGKLLKIVCENSWGSIPLTFVFEGLSHIPAGPVLKGENLQVVRQILVSCLTTHEVLTRGAIQCFICHMMINLIDLEHVSLSEVCSTLSALSRDESLRRGTSLWKAVLTWLSSNGVRERWKDSEILDLAQGYLQECTQDEDAAVTVSEYAVVSVARMLVLFADVMEQNLSEQALQQPVLDVSRSMESSPLGLVLAHVTDRLSDIRSRAYINTATVVRCLSLMLNLSMEVGDGQNSHVDKMIQSTLSRHFKDAGFFIRGRLTDTLTKAGDIEEVKFYMDVLYSLGRGQQQDSRCWGEMKELLVFVGRIFSLATHGEGVGQGCENPLPELDVLVMSATMLLSTVLKITHSSSSRQEEVCERSGEVVRAVQEMVSVLDVPAPFSVRSHSKDQIPTAHIGQVISSFISNKWKCQKYMFQHRMSGGSPELSGYTLDAGRLVDAAMEDLSIGSGSSDVPVFQALELVMEEILSTVSADAVLKLVEVCWSKVMEESKNIRFWKKLRYFIPLVLHPSMLLQDQGFTIGLAVNEFLGKLFALGTDKTGVMYIVFDHLCKQVFKGDPDWRIATRLIPQLVEGCYLGTLHKRGERLWLDVCAYIESLGDSCSINQITSSAARNDLYTRVIILNWLSKLRPDVPADQKFVSQFLHKLRGKYMKLTTLTSHKQFANSLSHRQKHRIVMVFLLLVDFISQADSSEYLSMLWAALDLESHSSVRQMLEWLVIILIHRCPSNISSVWDVFKRYDNRRSVCLCSLFLVISHLGMSLPSQMQADYYTQAITIVLPWTMAHHYNTRIFAQATLMRLWGQCGALELDHVTEKLAVVQSAVDFLANNGNASATVEKLLNNYLYSSFDPVGDFSMETIFHTLPRLACLADDEWVHTHQFVQMDATWEDVSQHLLPLRNLSHKLATCKEGPWRMRAPGDGGDDDGTAGDMVGGDVQKKIMPWRQMSPGQEAEAEFPSLSQRSSESGLVMVTSLIDKVPNLGGLCRTCEIFGVSEFVIGSLTYLEDKMFQSLSVSAQKWIKITEVMLSRLTEFLEEKRSQGYTLVGVEQTANSVSLQEYCFPRRTVLLLGNEREGIPVEIIQLLDVCVEVPQFGVIRSLNVHVCGALMVWEYTRQHMDSTN